MKRRWQDETEGNTETAISDGLFFNSGFEGS
jgi:hypothetical protein